ncbi:MAG: hypothetical protein IPK82_19885 [Polyangiaceae bacterium]|nr:hypothetical protein [Polyangiaceae bacterium]
MANQDLTLDNLRLHHKRTITFLCLTVNTEFSEIFQGQLDFVYGGDTAWFRWAFSGGGDATSPSACRCTQH